MKYIKIPIYHNTPETSQAEKLGVDIGYLKDQLEIKDAYICVEHIIGWVNHSDLGSTIYSISGEFFVTSLTIDQIHEKLTTNS